MHDNNQANWNGEYDVDKDDDGELNGSASSQVDGWQQYRRWISKAPAPNRRRSGVDPSLYTWKGYRDWTEQIKRNWSENS
ncbi:MAG: hypothetical protein AAF417_19995 [Pseudomonadota bacterium]